MTIYRISYCKTLQNSDGRNFKCLQKTVDVEAASPVDALTLAEERGLSMPGCECVEISLCDNAEVLAA